MKEGRIKVLKGYLNKRWSKGKMLRWMIEDESGSNTYCDKCGNIANGVVRAEKPSGVYNIPFCKSHMIEYFPEVDSFPCIVEYVNKRSAKKVVSVPKNGSGLYGLFQFETQKFVGYWTDKELADTVCETEYDETWYVDELCHQDG